MTGHCYPHVSLSLRSLGNEKEQKGILFTFHKTENTDVYVMKWVGEGGRDRQTEEKYNLKLCELP